MTQSKEIIISLQKTPVSAATHLTRVESLTVLGITFNAKFCFETHIRTLYNQLPDVSAALKSYVLMDLLGSLCVMLLN